MYKKIDMNGKVVMITGANSGIGKETAIQLANMGATIIMVCRNKERGEAALKDIKEKTNSNKIDLLFADLADQNSIRLMVEEFKKKYDKLHVLINNAGLILRKRSTTLEGYENTFAINYLGHFLLTYLLLDLLKSSTPARIINVSSALHKFAKPDFNDINMEHKYSGFRAYANSKLYNILFTYELARRLESTRVTVNSLHPGAVRTNFGKNNRKKLLRIIFYILRPFYISAKKGARTSIYLASFPEVEHITGKYFIKSSPKKSSKISYNQSFQSKLWNIGEKLTHISYFNKMDLDTSNSSLKEKEIAIA
ncbi:MAG: SDR family oxidoreductase [Promethearchaeota archaeon]